MAPRTAWAGVGAALIPLTSHRRRNILGTNIEGHGARMDSVFIFGKDISNDDRAHQ